MDPSLYTYCRQEVSEGTANSSYVHDMCVRLVTIVDRTRRYSARILDPEQQAPVDLAVPLMGYASPVVNIFTLILNTVIVIVLTRRRSRSPTNLILVSIAICDTVTGLFPVPFYMYVYTYSGYQSYPSMGWCIMNVYIASFIPKVFHTISLWLTALLAFNRHCGVSQMKCPTWTCGYKGVGVAMTIIIILSILCHSFELFTVLKAITVLDKKPFTSQGLSLVQTCYQETVVIHNVKYFSYVYTWVRLTFAQVMPCLVLIVCNLLLCRVTYRSYRLRRTLIIGHRVSEMAETRRTIRISVMLLLITSVTCVFELLVDVLLILNFVQYYSQKLIVDTDIMGRLLLISNFLIFLSFPMNFFFILVLSHTFRRNLTSCLKWRLKRKIAPHPCSKNDNNVHLVTITAS